MWWAGIRVDLTLYPLASTWRKAAGVFATLGLGVTLQKPFWLDSKARNDPSQHFPTNELQVEGGLRWRFVLYKKLPRPELTVLAGGGLHSFSINKEMGMDVGPPDVSYRYLAVGAALRLHFAEWASLWAQATYHVVFDAGPVPGADEFGAGLELRPARRRRARLLWSGAGSSWARSATTSATCSAFSGAGTPARRKSPHRRSTNTSAARWWWATSSNFIML